MRQVYIVTYDISHPKRLRKVYKLMRGWGTHIQLSVFRCELNHRELVELRRDLGDIINFHEDQVLFADLGPVGGRGDEVMSSLGRPYAHPEREAIVV